MSNQQTIDPTSPLYLHSSDGTSSVVVEKLQGSSNYRLWRRSLEISLAAKRKLGFVTGEVKRDPTDSYKQKCWDTYNNMVISWILESVTKSIKKSVMFVNNAELVWKQLEARFLVSNGARRLISEYYTDMRALWEELESLSVMPAKSALHKREEEDKLFQFLSGIDDTYGPQRSEILMMSVLPSVKEACNLIQQEESQRKIFGGNNEDKNGLAMMASKTDLKCRNCRKIGHATENCWACRGCGKLGYPYEDCWVVHGYLEKGIRSKRDQKGKGKEFSLRNNLHKGYNNRESTAKEEGKNLGKWSEGKTEQKGKMSANACTGRDDSEDEIVINFAEVITCNFVKGEGSEWILD
ncbi:Gag-Pol polyprotein [Bienertia sinuspersici]